MERWYPYGAAVVDRWEPARLDDIQGEMNKLFASVFGRPATADANGGAAERTWVPLSDIHETKDDLHVSFELPGVAEKDVSVSIMGDVLTVKGERRFERDLKDEGYHRVERVYGKFEREVPLPMPVQTDKVTATYRDGMLDIRLPKVEAVKPRDIKIDVQ